jgi:hypothetical protein
MSTSERTSSVGNPCERTPNPKEFFRTLRMEEVYLKDYRRF